MISLADNLLVIIRSAGERTESLCYKLILDQGVPLENIVTVRESPFSAAMHKSFGIGIDRNLLWTFCIDADVLLRPDSIRKMLDLAEQQPESVCEIQGFVLCKYFGGPRPAGNHLYRTALLDRVIDNIPAEGVNIRPEFYTLEAMKAKGFPWITVPCLVGLHDFEQYYKDIFRKCFVQAHKHDYLADLFLLVWRAGVEVDEDYRIALAGLSRGIEHDGPVFIDVRYSQVYIGFEKLSQEEKEPIDIEGWSLDRIESFIQDWREPNIYLSKFPDRQGLNCTVELSSVNSYNLWMDRLLVKYRELGLFRTVLFLFGWGIEYIGQRIQKKISRV